MGKLDAVVHLKGTKFFLSQYEMLKGYLTQAFWFSPISFLRSYEVSASTFRTCL